MRNKARRTHAISLLKSGATFGVIGAGMADGVAAEARSQGQKEQIEALKAAAAARVAAAQPAAELTGDHYTRAKLLLAAGDTPGAMAAFRRVIAEQPMSVDAMNGLAVTYDRMGRHDVARGWYEAALAIAPDDAAVLVNLGYSLSLQRDWHAAIPWLQAAARSDDAVAAATARRMLVRVDAELTAERVRAPAMARPAEIALAVDQPKLDDGVARPVQFAAAQLPVVVAALSATTSARIEIAAGGEAQLVLGEARQPAPELVAALGASAELVLTARLASAPDQPALAEVAPAAIRQVATVLVEAPVAMLSLAQSPEIVLLPSLAAARQQEDAALAVAEAPRSMLHAVASIAPPAKPVINTVTPAPIDSMRAALAPEALAHPSIAPAPVLTAGRAAGPAASARTADFDTAGPEWLLRVRLASHDGRSVPITPALEAALIPRARLFESDDGDLNSFAARMRGVQALESAAVRQAAIARLEALIARVRRA